MNKIKNVLVTRRYLITGAQRISNYWWASIISFGGLAFFITGFASFLQKGIFVFNQSKTITFFPQGLIMCFYGCLGLLFGFYLWCTVFWKVGDGFNEFNQNQGFVRIFRWGLPGKNRRVDFQYKMDEIESVRVELKEGVNPRRIISLKIKGKLYNAHASSPGKQVFAQSTSDKTKQEKASKALSDSRSGSRNFSTKTPTRGVNDSAKSSLPEKTEQLRSVDVPVKSYKGSPSQKAKIGENKTYSSQGFTVPLTRVGQPISLEKIESQASELAQFLRVSLETSYLDS